MPLHGRGLSATFVPGADDDYYMPPPMPDLVAPEPQRINPEMSNQIASGIEAVQNLDLNAQGSRGMSQPQNHYANPSLRNDGPHLSPFPKLVNPPPNVPPSDEELEATLENARVTVLNSNDPEMQLAWAADALVYVGVCADNEERTAAAKPSAARSATPRIEHQLKTDAMNITQFLADQHHPKAEFLRGMWLEWGRFGQREDKKESFRCFSRAADKGYARAEYRIGMLYESYNDPIKALRHYNRGVDAGDAASCYRLGMMTLRGQHGQPQDYNKAISLIRRSAENADENAAQGAYVYGMLLARQLPQITIPEIYLQLDERQARVNIEKAAYLKFAKAQLKMGSAYELGSLGCEFNPALSVHYNALASKQGEAEADMALCKWFLVGSEGLFPKNEELAFSYAERAAQSGLATGEFAMGYFNEIGTHVPVNLEKAMEWYEKASKHGNEDARGRIKGLRNKQVLSKKDHESVAVSRIKSQYGSMRGGRPDRLRQQQQPSSIQNSSIPEYNHDTAGSVHPPQRGTTPYPENDGPPRLPPINQRPGSVAPYPLQDGPQRQPLPGQGPVGGFFHVQQQPPPPNRPATTLSPELRPSTAFQINPDLRPNSTTNIQGGQYPGRPPYAAGPMPPGRPMTVQPYAGSPAPGPRPNAGYRVSSGPAAAQGYSSGHPPQHGGPSPAPQYGGPSPAPQHGGPSPAPQRPPMPPHQATAPAAPQQQQQQPKIDIGYSAPLDDRRSRTYGPARPAQNGATAPLPSKTPALRPTDSMPNFSQTPQPANPAAGRVPAPAKPSPAPAKPSQAPVKMTPRPPDSTVPTLPSKLQQQQQPPPPKVETPKPNTHTSTAPPATKPPGKGPKTFDEMGVPSQKQESECILM